MARAPLALALARALALVPPHLELLALVAALLAALCLALALLRAILALRNPAKRARILSRLSINEKTDGRRVVVGFFHPYCNAGGGGERVLWTAIACVQRTDPEVVSVVYTGDAVSKDAMIAKVQARFGITLDPRTLAFVTLSRRSLVEDSTWPRFTLLGQSLGSIILAFEALYVGLIPDIWLDTMGYAFPYPFVRALGIPVGSYTHYPTISTDMLHRVQSRQAGHTNTSAVARSRVLTYLKLGYYVVFAECYSFCLRRADVVMVNSTWTRRHVNRLLRPIGYRDDASDAESDDEDEERDEVVVADWELGGRVGGVGVTEGGSAEGLRRRAVGAQPSSIVSPRSPRRFKAARTVYPPCDTLSLARLPLEHRESLILSLAQFRPEKDHQVQLRAFAVFLASHPSYRLILAGSVRNPSDEARVQDLRTLAQELSIDRSVEFAINVPYPSLIALLGRASIGLHTMVDEHFGITVVEFMAAGLIPLVHASAGPLLDIVTPFEGKPTGFHATSAESFASQLSKIVGLEDNVVSELRERARTSATTRFGEDVFGRGWGRAWRELRTRGDMGRR